MDVLDNEAEIMNRIDTPIETHLEPLEDQRKIKLATALQSKLDHAVSTWGRDYVRHTLRAWLRNGAMNGMHHIEKYMVAMADACGESVLRAKIQRFVGDAE